MEMQLGAMVDGQLLHHDAAVEPVALEGSAVESEEDVSLPFRVADRGSGRTL
jgi:hypothetical protein